RPRLHGAVGEGREDEEEEGPGLDQAVGRRQRRRIRGPREDCLGRRRRTRGRREDLLGHWSRIGGPREDRLGRRRRTRGLLEDPPGHWSITSQSRAPLRSAPASRRSTQRIGPATSRALEGGPTFAARIRKRAWTISSSGPAPPAPSSTWLSSYRISPISAK